MEKSFELSFADADLTEANIYAGELGSAIGGEAPEATIQRRRSDPLNQDFGAILVVVLGTAAVKELAKGVRNWLSTRHEATLVIKRSGDDGKTEEIRIEGSLKRGQFEQIVDFLKD